VLEGLAREWLRWDSEAGIEGIAQSGVWSIYSSEVGGLSAMRIQMIFKDERRE